MEKETVTLNADKSPECERQDVPPKEEPNLQETLLIRASK